MEQKWYAKAWAFIKKYSALIVGGLATAIGFALGISLGRNNPDIAKLRESNRELINQIGQFRDELQLKKISIKGNKRRAVPRP